MGLSLPMAAFASPAALGGFALSSTTWSASTLAPSIVLSNGNLTAACGNGVSYSPGAGTGSAIGSGVKRYWEVHLDALGIAGQTSAGVVNASEVYNTGNYLGISTTSLGYFDDGTVIYNNATVTTLAVPVAGNTICVAVNSHNLIWFRINGGNWNNDVIANQNPATGTGGISTGIATLGDLLPAYNVCGTSGVSKVTANFGGSFAFTPPSGFTGLP